jgi:acid phosphatase (class A)
MGIELPRCTPHGGPMELRTLRCSLLLAALAGCSTVKPVVAPTSAAEVGELRPGFVKGYLAPEQLPDSLALLPAPPAPGTAAQAADDAAFHELTKFQGTPRGALAVADADLSSPHAEQTFSCALGVAISEQAMPNLDMLLRRSLTDAGLATYKAKNFYKRTRPFVMFKTASCTPDQDAMLMNDGSYPSGHTSIGWAWALVLAELAPDRADALLQRGRAFGQSRGVCGVHWKSDIDAGRLAASATVARLHAEPVFLAQLAAARKEVEAVRTAAPPAANCAAQAAALAVTERIAP